MTIGWGDLDRELNAWGAAGRTATFWWRDDDAIEPTPALDRLLGLAERTGTPIGIAIIPAAATAALVARLENAPHATPLQHGWSHRNHAPAGAKPAELGADRPLDAVCADIVRGRERLGELLGEPPRPFMVPPWNRIAPEIAARLPALGFTGLSASGHRNVGAEGGLAHANCHVDPVDWRGSHDFAGEERALGDVVKHLRARREGSIDPEEPTGFLTHHLVADEPGWAFTEALLIRTIGHGAARWLTPDAAFLTDGAA